MNWSEVVLDIAGREKAAIYRHVFEVILHNAQVKELLSRENSKTAELKDENNNIAYKPADRSERLDRLTVTDKNENDGYQEFFLDKIAKGKYTEDGKDLKDYEEYENYEDCEGCEGCEDCEDCEDEDDDYDDDDYEDGVSV